MHKVNLCLCLKNYIFEALISTKYQHNRKTLIGIRYIYNKVG